MRKGYRDIVKRDVQYGRFRLICGFENQDGIDNTMPERVMGYDYAEYEKQVKDLIDENKKSENPAFTKRIHENKKLAPLVTLVLNWGKEKWEKPLCLHDMLEFLSELPEGVRARFKSDFRFVAEYLAGRKSQKRFMKLLEKEDVEIRHPEELMDTLSTLSGDDRYREVISEIINKNKEEKKTMSGFIESN